MTETEKISKWINEQEAAGKSRDDIARAVFVAKSEVTGQFNVYRLSKAGKSKFHLHIDIGAYNLDEM